MGPVQLSFAACYVAFLCYQKLMHTRMRHSSLLVCTVSRVCVRGEGRLDLKISQSHRMGKRGYPMENRKYNGSMYVVKQFPRGTQPCVQLLFF